MSKEKVLWFNQTVGLKKKQVLAKLDENAIDVVYLDAN